MMRTWSAQKPPLKLKRCVCVKLLLRQSEILLSKTFCIFGVSKSVLVIFNKKQLNLILFCKLGTVVCTRTHICVCVVQCYLYYKMLMLNRCHWDWEGWVQISMDLLIVWMIYYETSSWMLYLQEGGICLVLNLLVFHVCWAFSSWKIHLYLLMPTGNYLL